MATPKNLMTDSKAAADCSGTVTYLAAGSSIFIIVSMVIVVGSYFGFWLGVATSDPAEITKQRVNLVLWIVALVVSGLLLVYAYNSWTKSTKLAQAYMDMEAAA